MSFTDGLMTGANLGRGMYRARGDRQVGAAMAQGNFGGAAAAAYGQGDLQTGQALDTQARQQAERKRGLQQTDALRAGNYDEAMSFAQSPEEMAQVMAFRNNASEAERAQAAARSAQMAELGQAVRALPPEQRLSRAQQLAQQYGIDPAQITPDTVTDAALESFTIRALGLADYLKYQQDQRDAMSPRYVPALGGFIMPPSSPGMPQGQPETLDALPQDARIRPRPNQPSPATAAGGGERGQPVSVSFRSSQEAQAAITSLVPGVRVTSGARSPADNRRVGGAAGSFHLQDRARDLVPPPGMSMAQLEAKMRQAGFRALNEGDHIHVSW